MSEVPLAIPGAGPTIRPPYRDTSLIRNTPPVAPYSRNMPRALRWSWGEGAFFC